MPKASGNNVRIPYLLRKSRSGEEAVVLSKGDFPMRFRVGDKAYVTKLTKQGGVITTADE